MPERAHYLWLVWNPSWCWKLIHILVYTIIAWWISGWVLQIDHSFMQWRYLLRFKVPAWLQINLCLINGRYFADSITVRNFLKFIYFLVEMSLTLVRMGLIWSQSARHQKMASHLLTLWWPCSLNSYVSLDWNGCMTIWCNISMFCDACTYNITYFWHL